MDKGCSLRVSGLACALVSGVLGACGTPAAQAPLSPGAPNAARAASSGELSEIGTFTDRGTPAGAVIWLRVPAPGRDIPLIGTLLGVGSMFDPTEVLSQKLGPSLSRTVDLSRPVDLTSSGLDEGPARLVLAASIFDAGTFASQVSQDFRVAHESQGRWRLVPKAKSPAGSLECELWHAAAPVGARLICATQPGLIDKQGEFLMAAARTRVDRSNVHAEVPGDAVREFSKQRSAQASKKERAAEAAEPPGARAGREMAERWIADWMRDSGAVSWDLTLRRDSVELSMGLGFSSVDSLFPTTLSGRREAVKAVPDAFWQLPNDSDSTLYWEGADPERMRRHAVAIVHEMRKSMEAEDEFETPPQKFDQIETSLNHLILRGGAFELAYGRDLNQAARALNDAAEHGAERGPRSGSADPALKKAQAQLGAWGLIGIEDDSRGYMQALRDALALATDKKEYPRKKGTKSVPSSTSLYFREIPLPASAGLPASALHFSIRSEPNSKYVASKAKPPAPAASVYHVIAVPDAAQHLWVVLSSDETLALSRLHSVLSPEPGKTLGASDELRTLAKQPLAGLGFGTLAAINGFGLSADSLSDVRSSRSALKQLWALPKRGATRIPLWITRAQPGPGANQRTVAYNVRLTPDAIGDLLAIYVAQPEQAEVESE